MFGRKGMIGLDIGSSSVKLVELSKSKTGWELLHFKVAPLPPEAIVDGSIMNTGAVVEVIADILRSERIKTKNVATSVSGNSVIVKKIKLPQMSPEELQESIQWEAEQYIPFDIADVNLDVHIVGADENDVGQMDVLLVAAKKDIINDRVSVLSEAGLVPQVMDVDAFAIANMFEVNYAISPGETVVVVDIGAHVINVNVMKNGVTTFARDISMGGNLYTEEIQKQLSVSYEEAETLKLGGDPGAPSETTTEALIPQEVGSIIRAVSESIAIEIQRSLDFYLATVPDQKIQSLFLSGGSARVPGLASSIEAKTDIATEVVNPFKAITISDKKFNLAYIQDIASSAAVAVGLAMREVDDK